MKWFLFICTLHTPCPYAPLPRVPPEGGDVRAARVYARISIKKIYIKNESIKEWKMEM